MGEPADQVLFRMYTFLRLRMLNPEVDQFNKAKKRAAVFGKEFEKKVRVLLH